jgi:hypothetical protein
VFSRRPLGFATLLLAYMFAALAVSVLVPLAGGLVALMALPLLGLGFMVATRSALAGGPVHPGQLVEPLRGAGGRRKPLLLLCALYGLLAAASLALCAVVMGDALDKLVKALATPNPSAEQLLPALTDPRLQYGFYLMAALIGLLSVPFWHAPALVLWGGQGVAQSLFSSTVALWRCKGAFGVYGAVWLAVTFTLNTLLELLLLLLGLQQLLPMLAFPLMLIYTAAFYVSTYFSFADSFEADAEA